MTREPLLEVDNIYAGYSSGSTVLNGISLTIDEGSITSLLGRNGVGKSTTLRVIMGLLKPVSGVVRFDGTDITGSKPHQSYAKGIGLVPEDRRIFPDLSVQENLAVPIHPEAGTEWSVERVLDLFPALQNLKKSMGDHLSGGEKQMLSIARALRAGPDLLMLDEPSEGLAPQIVDDVVGTIENVAATGTTVLLVEQNVRLALALASSHRIMDAGEIVFEGDDRAVRENEDVIERYLGVRSSPN